MVISISNVIINYFLTHPEVQILSKDKLDSMTIKIKQKFCVQIPDFSNQGIRQTVQIFNDFLSLNDDYSIVQNNILNYLDDLQPVYQYLSFNQWDKQYQYYKFLREF